MPTANPRACEKKKMACNILGQNKRIEVTRKGRPYGVAPSRDAMEGANQRGTEPQTMNMQGRALLERSYGRLLGKKRNEAKERRQRAKERTTKSSEEESERRQNTRARVECI